MIRRTAVACLLVGAVILLSTMTGAAVSPVLAQDGQDVPVVPSFVPGQLIIRFAPGVTAEQIDAFYKEYGLTEMDDLHRTPTPETAALKLTFVPVEVNQPLIDRLQRDPRVAYAEPNYILQVSKTPDDPDFAKLWGLNNTGQTGGAAGADIDVVKGWDVTTGSSTVVVAIIDTGVDYTHEDLGPNMWVNPAECPGGYGECEADGVDDDNNGYVDDFYGINAVTGTGDPMDDYGHGTHVAGTIGAKGNNTLGVVGVNFDVSIIACKFLGATGGGSVADAVKCFDYVNYLKNTEKVNIVATNNSWGGTAPSQALEDAMAGPDQPLHICAAGNSDSDAPHYPSAFDLDNIISVAATDHADLYADFSNYGPTVDLAAPGVNIFSTMPTGNCPICDPSGYGSISGTSMATPHVTGAVALIAAKYPTLSLAQIRQRILSGVDPLSDAAKTTLTNGRLNVFNTLEEDTNPPAPVSDLTVKSLLLTQVELTWSATGDDGMSGQANGYDIRYSTTPISPENWDNAQQAIGEPKPKAPGEKESFAVSGLEPDTTYYFAMKVMDNVGNVSALSNIVIGKTSAGTIVFEDDMESGEGDWTTAGIDQLWHLSESRSNSPTHAWYYGDETKHNYDTGTGNNGTLTSPPIELTTNADVLLTFYEWSQLESSASYDRTRVQLSTDEGVTWTTVFESHGTNDEWAKRTISLTPFIGDAKSIHVRFWFDSIDNRFNTFEGWYVDDVTVLVAQPGVPGQGPALPNLVMQESNIGLSNPDPVEGDDLTVYAVVVNNGGAEANEVSVQFMDATGDSPAPLGAPQVLPNIPVGGSATAQIAFDTVGKAGEHTVQVVVDPFNLIAEGNEADNLATHAFTVTAPAAPNLVIDMTNIAFNPATPQPGDQVTVHAVVRNDGAVDAAQVAVQVLDVTDAAAVTPIGQPQLIDLLTPGASAAVEVTYDTAGLTGDRKIRVVLDPQNSIAESDEDDNDAQATLKLATTTLPNLALSSLNVGFDPAAPAMGDDVTVLATIFNSGAQPAQNVSVQFMDVTDGSSPIGDPQVVALIPAGGSGVAQVVYSTAGVAGDRKIEITVDPYNFIAETSETDNEVRVTLSVTPPPAPNLTMLASNIGFQPAAPIQGDDVTIAAVVLNTGDAPADGITVQFLDVTNGVILPIGERQTIDALAPGAGIVAQVVYSTTGLTGQRRIQVVVDPNNFVPEANETDNEATASLTIAQTPAPNLSMSASNITFAPSQPTAGDDVTITAVVVNNGAAPAARVLVQFIDVTNGGFVPIGAEQTIESVQPGASATASAVYSTTGMAGSRKIQVLVDSNNLIPELDENDNDAVATLPVRAAPLANLTVSTAGIGFNPTQPSAGNAITVTVTVHNQGAAPAENVVVQLLDMSDGEPMPVGQAQTVDSIPGGGAAIVTFAYGGEELPAGERLLRVVVDPSNFVIETDETDNRAGATVTVDPAHLPNLAVLPINLGFLPPAPVDGDLVTLTVTILNTGSSVAEKVLVQFVDVSGGAADPIGAKQTIPAIAPGASADAQVVYDTTGKTGERRIRVVADPHGTVAETAENDNEAVAVLRIAAGPFPNLTARPENIGLSTANPAPGEPVTVTATILNTGAADAENVVVQFVDATDSTPMPIAAGQLIDRIPAGGAATASILYDTRGRFGSRKVQVIVDPNNLILERDENDNKAAGTLTIAYPPVANLVLRSTAIGFDPPEAGSEGTVVVYATVLNDGDMGVGEVVVQFLDVTDGGSTPIGEPQTISAIGPGGSGLVQVTYAVPAGAADRKLQVVVDPNNTIVESSESDNQSTTTLKRSKAALANLALTIDNVTFSPATPIDGDTVTIRAVVFNNGAADAQDVVVQMTDTTGDGAPIGPQQVIPAIPAGSSATVEVTYVTTGKAGTRSIRVAVDPNNFIPETSDTDNTATVSLDIGLAGRPNLVVTGGNVNFSPVAPTSGQAVTVRAVILNHGAREARDVVVQFVDVSGGDQLPISTPQTISRIAPGAAATAQVVYPTDGLQGERTLQVIADPNNFIVESNENDNRAVKPLIVGAPPAANLVMLSSNVDFVPDAPQDGNLVTIHATALNNGSASATDVVVRIEDITTAGAPELIGKQRLIDALAPGEAATVQVTYDTTDKAGERRIQVTLDPANTVPESDEQDNSAIVPLTVAPPPAPNLVVSENNVRFTPVAPSDGQVVTITVTVLNEGQRNASRVEVQVMDTTNGTPVPIGDVQVIGGIPAGGTGIAQVTYDTTGKEGDRLIQVTADPANLISETDEDDNQVEVKLTVGPPSAGPGELPNLSLTSGSVVISPTMPAPGDIVTLTIQVANTGEGDANGVVVRVTDTTDGDSAPVGDDITIPTLAAGEVYTVEVAYDTTDKTGSRTLKVEADPDNTIEETSEFDNSTTVTIPLNGGSDEPAAVSEPTARGNSPTTDQTAADGVNVEVADDLIRRANDPAATP